MSFTKDLRRIVAGIIAPSQVKASGGASSLVTQAYAQIFSTLGLGGNRKTLVGLTGNSAQMEYKQAVNKGFNNIVWVYKCIFKNAESVGSIPYIAVDRQNKRVMDHPLELLTAKPNRHSFRSMFMSEISMNLDLAGQSFLEVTYDKDMPYVMFNVRPDFMFPIPDKTAFIKGYNFSPTKNPADDKVFPPECIIWIRYPNPMNPYGAQSPMTALKATIESEESLVDWNNKLLERNAIPGGLLSLPSTTLDPVDIEEHKAHLMKEFSGNNSLLPMIAWGGMKWEQLGLKPDDLQAISQREINKEEICGLFGVPGEIVGAIADPTYQNREAARKAYWQDTVGPRVNYVLDALNAHFGRYYNDGVTLTPDFSQVPALQEVMGEKINQSGKLFLMGYPTNVINQKMQLGMPDIDGGDIGFVPVNVAPLLLAGDLTPDPIETDPAKPPKEPKKPTDPAKPPKEPKKPADPALKP